MELFNVLILARLQFAATTIFHFFFVPLSIGLALFIAILQTKYVRSGEEQLKPMIKFLGKMFTVLFAMGIATGIVQEFQFGMNWSEYSRMVGDIFGAPLAIEALLAFFIESTFLGLWIFGWNKLSKKLHLFCIWMVSFASACSALWILAANSFMQRPVGYHMNPDHILGPRAELTNLMDLFTNSFMHWQYLHVFTAALATAGFFILSICAYQLVKGRNPELFGKVFKQAAAFAIIGSIGVGIVGHFHGLDVYKHQPMKMSAADAHWNTSDPSAWPIVAIPSKAQGKNLFDISIPGLYGLLIHHKWGAPVAGINDLKADMKAAHTEFRGGDEAYAEYVATYGEVDYVPNVWMTFYAFRIMVAAGLLMILLALLAFLWRNDPKQLQQRQTFLKILGAAIILPFAANACGWILAEMGRQPWIVYGIQTVNEGVSSSAVVTQLSVLFSLLGYIVIYTTLAIIAGRLILKFCREGMQTGTGGEL
jgi:cytochrome d ubiquinol oxidase subunit I